MQDEVLPRFPKHLAELKEAEIWPILSPSDGTVNIYSYQIPFSDISASNPGANPFFPWDVPSDGATDISARVTAMLGGGEIHPCGPTGPGDKVFNSCWDS